MKCLMPNCNVERGDLSQHIYKEHGISTAEYKKRFNIKYVIDEERRKQRGQNRKELNRKRYFNHCEICNENFSTIKALYRHCYEKEDSKHSKIIFNESNINDWVECKLCGLRRSIISNHIRNYHNITNEDLYVETKNWTQDLPHVELFKQQYPLKRIVVLFQDSELWKKIERYYSYLIPLWETWKQNLRTKPELYL